MRVGEYVDIKTVAKQVLIEKGGVAKSSDFVTAGIRAVDVINMCNAGYLDRIRHGYYQLAEADTSSEAQLQNKCVYYYTYIFAKCLYIFHIEGFL